MKIRPLSFTLTYLLAANAPVWLAAHIFGLQLRGYFNIEFAAIGILVVALSPLAISILLLGATALDIVSSISWTYMLPTLDLLESARSMDEYLPSHIWAVAGVAVTLAVSSFASVVVLSRLESRHERRMSALILGAFSACCIITDIKTGQIRTLHPDKLVGSIRLTREPLRVLRLAKRYGGKFAGGSAAPFDRASTLLIQRISMDSSGQQVNRPNVVLILVESWGKPLSREVDESLVRPYISEGIRRKYTLSEGTVGFYGPTVAGEARELCGSSMGFEIIHATSSQLKSCLPAWFRQRNYHTTAIHGFAQGMFQRKDWYARAGFEEKWFRESLAQEGLSQCIGAFPGVCDAEVPD